jgi:hypothetical protein
MSPYMAVYHLPCPLLNMCDMSHCVIRNHLPYPLLNMHISFNLIYFILHEWILGYLALHLLLSV